MLNSTTHTVLLSAHDRKVAGFKFRPPYCQSATVPHSASIAKYCNNCRIASNYPSLLTIDICIMININYTTTVRRRLFSPPAQHSVIVRVSYFTAIRQGAPTLQNRTGYTEGRWDRGWQGGKEGWDARMGKGR